MIKINLLPKEARKHAGLGEQIAILIILLVGTMVGIGFRWNYLDGVIAQKQQEIVDTEQKLQELQKVIEEIKEFEKRRDALIAKLAVIARLEKEQKMPVYLLDEIYSTLQDDLWLLVLAQSGSLAAPEATIDLQGTALSNPVVANYVRNLQESKYFTNVELAFSRIRELQTQEVRDFQVSATLTVEKGMLADLLTYVARAIQEKYAGSPEAELYVTALTEESENIVNSEKFNELLKSGGSLDEIRNQFETALKEKVKSRLTAEQFDEFLKIFESGVKVTAG